MTTRSLIQCLAGTVLVLPLLTGCGDATGVDVDIDRGHSPNWPWPWSTSAHFFVERTLSEDVPVDDQTRIRLDAVNGSITIVGRLGTNAVTVTAELRVGSNEGVEDANEGLDLLDVLVTKQSEEILVQTLQPSDPDGRQYIVDYTLTVPSDLVVDVDQVNGFVTVEYTENSVFVDAVNGTIDVASSSHHTRQIRLATINGDLDLRIPTTASAQLSASVKSGSITWENLDLTDLFQTNRSLEGTLGDGVGVIDLDTRNGGIHLTGLGGRPRHG